jgi:hypothetical protein
MEKKIILFYFISFTIRIDAFNSEPTKDQMYRFDDNRFKKQSSVSISNIEHSKYVKANSKNITKTQPREQPHKGAAANAGAATGEAMETAAAGAAVNGAVRNGSRSQVTICRSSSQGSHETPAATGATANG